MDDMVSGVGVVDKSVAILAALAERGPSSLADLVAATGLARPTAHRLAVALEAHGLVARDARGRFRPGVRLLAWGARSVPGAEVLVDAAGPVLRRLRDATGESAQVYVRDGDGRVCVAAAERATGLRDTVPVGAVLSMDAGSGAKVLVAWSEPGAERAAGATEAVGAAGHAFSAGELAAVRRAGWAATVGEREPGVASVSAPVHDRSGAVVAALSVSGPVDRLGRRPGDRLAGVVVAAAAELTDLLASG